MLIFIEKTGEKHELDFSGTVQDLLQQLSINPQTVLVVREGELLTEDITLSSSDSLSLLSVISGG